MKFRWLCQILSLFNYFLIWYVIILPFITYFPIAHAIFISSNTSALPSGVLLYWSESLSACSKLLSASGKLCWLVLRKYCLKLNHIYWTTKLHSSISQYSNTFKNIKFTVIVCYLIACYGMTISIQELGYCPWYVSTCPLIHNEFACICIVSGECLWCDESDSIVCCPSVEW